MTPDKWKKLNEDSHFLEKPFLYLHRLYQQAPWWVYGFFFAYCAFVFVDALPRLQESDELVPAFVFLMGIGPFFFFYSLKFMLWMMLRIRGFRAEDLKTE